MYIDQTYSNKIFGLFFFLENMVKTKWRNIRDRFVKELRKSNGSSVSGAGADDLYDSKWVLFDELKFLSAHCENRP